jgi:hypothetical protein
LEHGVCKDSEEVDGAGVELGCRINSWKVDSEGFVGVSLDLRRSLWNIPAWMMNGLTKSKVEKPWKLDESS